MDISAIIITHNQREALELEIESILMSGIVDKNHIFVADNFSDDDTHVWLEEQKDISFIIFDDEIHGYAQVLNTIIREFEISTDLLIISPTYFVLPTTLRKMQTVLQSGAGAVSCNICRTDGDVSYEQAVAIDKANTTSFDPVLRIDLQYDLVLISREMILTMGAFNEKLFLPHNVILDFLFDGLEKGFRYFLDKKTYCYQIGQNDDYFNYLLENDFDEMQRRWGMKYFNDSPNPLIIKRIIEDDNASFPVLEVGCDCGANLLGVKEKYPNVELFGVEINEAAAKIASYFANVKTGNIEDKNIDFGETRFKYILFGDVLEHLRDPQGTLEFCKSILMPDGYIIANIPNLMNYRVMKEIIDGRFTYEDHGLLDRTHIHFFTYFEIIDMFNRAGYTVEEINYNGDLSDETKESKRIVDTLLSLSSNTERFMYDAYQYIVKASVK